MVHGEDHARAFTGGSSARVAEKMAASALGHAGVGSGSLSYDQGTAVAKGPPAPSILTIVRSAEHADDMVGELVKATFALAERAEGIATRLAGSYPVPGPSENATGRGIDPDSSGFAAMQSAVDGISRRALSADPAFARLSAALDQIERTLG